MERWRGRVAIVTGASAGIGWEIAKVLAENGMKVVAIARRLERLQSLAKVVRLIENKTVYKKGELHPLQGDVTKEEDILRVVKWTRDTLGGADVLVNNAGLGFLDFLADVDTRHVQQTLDANVLGLSLFTRDVIKDMRDRGVDDGHIFLINSNAGHRVSQEPGLFLYAASKHAVTVLTEGLRRELLEFGTRIRITSLSPGLVRTEIMEAAGIPSALVEQRYARQPHLQPKDVADTLVFALAAPPHVQVHEISINPTGGGYV